MKKLKSMLNIDQAVFAFAGIMILISISLAYWFSPNWLILTMLIGLNITQAAFTGFCPLAMLLSKLGFTAGKTF